MNSVGNTAGTPPVTPRLIVVSRILLAMAFLAAGLVFIHFLNGPIWPEAFFDGRVFGRTVEDIRAGFAPYDLMHGRNPPLALLPLVQPPHVAILLEALAATPLSVEILNIVVTTLIATGVLTGVIASARMFIDTTTSGAILGLGLFAAMLAGGGMIAAVTGNQSGLLMGLAFVSMLVGYQRRDWRLFHALVFIAVLFKPYFASFWIIPVLQNGWSWRHFWIGTALLAAAALVYWASASARPDLLAGWIDVMGSRHALGDVGAGLYAMHYEWGENITLRALAVHAVFVAILLGMLMFSAASGTVRLASLAIAAVAINPRMNAYEYAFTAIPIFHVMTVRARQLLPVWGERLVLPATLCIGILTMWLFMNNPYLNSLVLVMVMFVAVAAATQWRKGLLPQVS